MYIDITPNQFIDLIKILAVRIKENGASLERHGDHKDDIIIFIYKKNNMTRVIARIHKYNPNKQNKNLEKIYQIDDRLFKYSIISTEDMKTF